MKDSFSRWSTLVDNFAISGQEFFAEVEGEVRAREVPDVEFSRVRYKEGGLGSAKREYLRIMRGKFAFDLTAFPYGTSQYFGWWLHRLGPEHPWLWLLGFLTALGLWAVMLLMSLVSALGGGDGSGCFLLLLLFGIPAGLIGLGLAIHENKLAIDEEDVLAVPVIGWLYEKLFSPNTMFAHDSAMAMQESVRRAVNEVIDSLLTDQGLLALSDEVKKPTQSSRL